MRSLPMTRRVGKVARGHCDISSAPAGDFAHPTRSYPLMPLCSMRSIHDTVTYITTASAESTDTATQTYDIALVWVAVSVLSALAVVMYEFAHDRPGQRQADIDA